MVALQSGKGWATDTVATDAAAEPVPPHTTSNPSPSCRPNVPAAPLTRRPSHGALCPVCSSSRRPRATGHRNSTNGNEGK